MRVFRMAATFILGTFLAVGAVAQQPQGGTGNSNSQPSILVVDVGYLLENHPTMKSEIEQVTAQMKEADQRMVTRRNDIIKKMEQLSEQFVEGTPEYLEREKQIAEADTQLRLDLVKERKKFEKAQANVLYKVFSQISSMVKYYCENTGAQIVLRVSRKEMDPNKPETIQGRMSQEVLYNAPKADITDWVLQALNQQAGKQTASAGRSPKR